MSESRYNDRTDTIEYNGTQVEVKRHLAYEEAIAFVNTVAKSCFDDAGEYTPEIKDYVLRYVTLRMYTNIELPDDTSESYEFVYEHEDLLFEIKDVFDESQFHALIDATDEKIRYLIDTKANNVRDFLIPIRDAAVSVIDDFKGLFSDIDNEDVKRLVSALANSQLNENEFVKTYMEQFKEDTSK